MTRLLCVLLLTATFPALGFAADLSAEEILTRMRMQAGQQHVIAGKQQGLPPQTPKSAGDEHEDVPSDGGKRPGLPAGDGASINLQIFFEFDSARLAPAAQSQLRELCMAFREASDIDRPFLVIGHTDAVGNETYNWRLSNARAQEVRRYLIEDCGIAGERLRAEGRGEEELRAGLNPRDPLHRRVEIKIAQ